MKYDLIIVSKSSTPELVKVTENCIKTASQDKADLNIIVVETSDQIIDYDVDEVVKYKGYFKYNKALNMGLQKAKGDVHILANNDILFHRGWSQIGEAMKINKFDSACALSTDPRQKVYKRGDWIYEGYNVGTTLVGWCIFSTRECIETIGGLDESFDFWYSDNVYADQLMRAKLRHGLFCNVQVDHITSVTLKTIPRPDQRRYSHDATKRYYMLKNAR